MVGGLFFRPTLSDNAAVHSRKRTNIVKARDTYLYTYLLKAQVPSFSKIVFKENADYS
jgi:hypothetical protein